MTEYHYINVLGPKLVIVRTPWPMPRWHRILQALTSVMNEHGLRQKDISSVDGLVSMPGERDDKDIKFIERIERAYAGDATILPVFWLYDWRDGTFVLARPAVTS